MTAVTAVVLARNEERHLPDCLASLLWTDELVVLDSASTDRTPDIARRAGARVVDHPFENFSRQRQHALSLVTTPWILFVDADERVPPDLASEVRETIAQPQARGYWIARINYFWGRRMRGGGWWPDYQLRLLSVAHSRYDPERAVHEVAEVAGPTERLVTPMIHYNYDSLAEFRSKQREYALLEARRRRAAGHQVRLRSYIAQPLRELWRRYGRLQGWRDGLAGLLLCSLMGWYELVALRDMGHWSPDVDGSTTDRGA